MIYEEDIKRNEHRYLIEKLLRKKQQLVNMNISADTY